MKKVCIIGAGASGLAAAVSAAQTGAEVTVYEHQKEAALKLRLTGNKKCNFTNRCLNVDCYHTDDRTKLEGFLKRFGTDDAIAFIESLGLKVHERCGYYYPYCDSADAVADALIGRCSRLGVRFVFSCKDFYSPEELFDAFDAVILSTGGRSYKKTGSNGTGYKYPEALGISYSWIMPALTAMESNDSFFSGNNGRRILAEAELYEMDTEGHMIFRGADTGEIQINERTLSGIPVMNLSGQASDILHRNRSAVLRLNFRPDRRRIPEIVSNRSIADIGCPEVFINISGTGKIDKAQVVRGGIGLSDLDENLRCIKTEKFADRRIYAVGELCDVDGICGGYNLHWAWASGSIAGHSAGI